MRTVQDKIIVRKLVDEADKKSAGGLYIPSMAKEDSYTGVVIAVGPGLQNLNGEHMPLLVKVDDMISYHPMSGAEINVDGQEFVVMQERDVLAIL